MTRPHAAELKRLAVKVNKWKRPRRELVLILVLALVTVLLGICGYRLTAGGFSFGNSSSGEMAEFPAEVRELISPSVIAAGNGSGSFFLIDQEAEWTAGSGDSSESGTAWDLILSTMHDFFSGRTRAAVIGESEYTEIAAGNTVEAVFSCDLPFDEFMEFNEMNAPGGVGIGFLSRLTLSAANGGTLCIYDDKEERCYRVTSRKNTDILTEDLIDSIRAFAEKNAPAEDRRYAPDGVWYGRENLLPADADPSGKTGGSTESGNTSDSSGSRETDPDSSAENTQKTASGSDQEETEGTVSAAGAPWMVPASMDFTPEYDTASKKSINRLEEVFFPQGMDFIQKLEHPDGSLTYMYGTTEKVLKVEADSGFTFSMEKKGSRWTPDFYSALSKAVEYIKKRGGWPGESADVTVRLTEVESIERDSEALINYTSSGWRFTFGLELLGLPLVYEEGDEIQMYVDVYGSGVTEYHRDLPELTDSAASAGQSAGTGNTPQNSTSLDLSAAASGEESAASSVQQAEALSLENVIKADSTVFMTALADKGTKLEKMTKEELEAEIMEQITAADPEYLRVRDQNTASTAGGSRASSGSVTSSGSSGSSSVTGVQDSENSSGTAAADWNLVPAWRIVLNEKIFLFDAVTGQLLQSS